MKSSPNKQDQASRRASESTARKPHVVMPVGLAAGGSGPLSWRDEEHANDKSTLSVPSSTASIDQECDFGKNPTVLSRLIVDQKYAAAIRRVHHHPQEAMIWVYTKPTRRRRRGEEYSSRQLPIHMCCATLFQVVDASRRSQLEVLIGDLGLAYPAGCTRRDHEGRLPLHEAIWHNCKAETISILLIAAPQAVHELDKYGRTTVEINEQRTGISSNSYGTTGNNQITNKEEVRRLLTRGHDFWEMARQEANLRMLERTIPYDNSSYGYDDYIGHSYVSGSSYSDDESSANSHESLQQVQNTSASNQFSKRTEIQTARHSVEPLSMSQLQKRATFLEEALAETFQKNFELSETISMLKTEKKQMLLTSTETRKQVNILKDENNQLKKAAADLEARLVTSCNSEKNSNAEVCGDRCGNGPHTDSVCTGVCKNHSIVFADTNQNHVQCGSDKILQLEKEGRNQNYLEDENRALLRRVERLAAENRDCKSKLEYYRSIAGSIPNKELNHPSITCEARDVADSRVCCESKSLNDERVQPNRLAPQKLSALKVLEFDERSSTSSRENRELRRIDNDKTGTDSLDVITTADQPSPSGGTTSTGDATNLTDDSSCQHGEGPIIISEEHLLDWKQLEELFDEAVRLYAGG